MKTLIAFGDKSHGYPCLHKPYHEIGFRDSERLHPFCILHFEFCISGNASLFEPPRIFLPPV